MRRTIRIAAALLPLAATAAAAQLRIPSETTLKKILWEAPRFTDTPEAKVKGLRQELERVVRETIDGAPWAPLNVIPGRGGMQSYFQDVSETFYALALAYPHLAPATQKKVKEFLDKERSARDPLTDYYPYEKGARREHYVIGPKARSVLGKGNYNYRGIRPHERLYRIWAFHYYTGTAVDAKSWDRYQRCRGARWRPTHMYWYASENDRLSCQIALARLAHTAGDIEGVRITSQAAIEAVKARLRFEDENRPVIGMDREKAWHGYASEGGIFIRRSGNNRAWVPRWRNLTPEIGRLLLLGAKDDVEEQGRYIDVGRPVGHLAWGPKQFEGEVATNQPHQAMSLFQAKAYILRRPADELRYYADVLWCKADLYYIEKLVCVIQAHGKLSWRDVRKN